jgi:hypothetical protein
MKYKKPAALALATVMAATLASQPAQAGQAEIDLLNSYLGNWTGAGHLVGGEKPEDFRCRLTIAKGSAYKINYSGRCALINMNLSVAGTIAFNDDKQRYEAIMSSNAGFTGQAVGKESGGQISFDLAERQKDRGGNDVRIGSRIRLANGAIALDFEVEFNDSGKLLTASVPFQRK